MHIERIIPVILMFGLSCITGTAGWYLGGGFWESNDGGFVIGFLLPTLISCWLSRVNIQESNQTESVLSLLKEKNGEKE